MAKPKVAVIILNWNGLKDTLECLKSVTTSITANLKLQAIVVDNGSTDNSVKVIRQKFPKITLIENEANLGFSGGNNVGIKAALKNGADYVILLNNDTTVDKKTFSNLLKGATKDNFDIASPKIYFSPGREFHHDSYKDSERGKVIWYAGGRINWDNVWPSQIGVDEVDHGQFDQPTETQFATGCCMLIKRSVLNRIGSLDTAYQAYFEDSDFCLRAKKKGYSIGYIPSSIMWHKNAGSIGGAGSAKQGKLVDLSRLIFAKHYAPLRAKLALLKHRLLKSKHY